MSIDLSVNLNKIALIRNSRPGNYPDVLGHGKLCLDYGAQGLTVHPRPDQRHIRPSDVSALAKLLKAYPERELNIEGNPFAPAQGDYPGLMQLVAAARPQQCTLVPDSNHQATSDHGFNLEVDGERLLPIIAQLQANGARVCLFMEPDLHQIALAKQVGADRIELYTGPFAASYATRPKAADKVFDRYCTAAQFAHELGLDINAGHDLNLQNMQLFRTLPHLQEVSIGHALTVESLHMGLQKTVAEYLKICSK